MEVARLDTVGPSEVDLLSRLLRGYRVRRETRSCAVRGVSVTPDGRRLDVIIEGAATRQVSIDLPEEFNPRENAHVVWLLGWLERVALES
jgi:hypothetical protein